MNVLRLNHDDLGHGGVVIPAPIRRLRRTPNDFHTTIDSTLKDTSNRADKMSGHRKWPPK